MPRPQRIEYENAFYHVMNRGQGRQSIFPDDRYYQAFLETLAEAHQRFKCIIHAYCLMGNHYHLLMETPLANLGRIMRHINGVYTQRHNRLKKTDGPLFRGRYKAILVDRDAYLLQLTRYIHRNPIEMKRPMVSQLSEYRWSSYPAYIGKAKPQKWLARETTYDMLGSKQRYKGYATYISQGIDEETAQIYNKGNQASIIGDKRFKSWVYEELLPELEAEDKGRILQSNITITDITRAIAELYGTNEKEIRKVIKGPQKGSEARKMAMYLSQEVAAARLCEIADYFNLNHNGSVSFITHQIRAKKRENTSFRRKIDRLVKEIVKKVT